MGLNLDIVNGCRLCCVAFLDGTDEVRGVRKFHGFQVTAETGIMAWSGNVGVLKVLPTVIKGKVTLVGFNVRCCTKEVFVVWLRINAGWDLFDIRSKN